MLNKTASAARDVFDVRGFALLDVLNAFGLFGACSRQRQIGATGSSGEACCQGTKVFRWHPSIDMEAENAERQVAIAACDAGGIPGGREMRRQRRSAQRRMPVHVGENGAIPSTGSGDCDITCVEDCMVECPGSADCLMSCTSEHEAESDVRRLFNQGLLELGGESLITHL